MNKTNAMRILDKAKISYEEKEYPSDIPLDAISVANYLNQPLSMVYKTLVTANGHNYYVFCLPSDAELDLKVAAKEVNEKSLEMIPQKQLLPLTGYIHGGCSPVGMKKQFPTIIDLSAKEKDYIFVSGGKVGLQIKVNPRELCDLIQARFVKITR